MCARSAGTERRLRAGGLDPAAGRADPGHGAAHRRRRPARICGPSAGTGPAEDVFAVQTEIAEQVAGRVGGWGVVVAAERTDRARRKRPEDLSAYELYLRGIEAMRPAARKESTEEAVRLFTQAVDEGPRSRPSLDCSGRSPGLHRSALVLTSRHGGGRRKEAAERRWRSIRRTPMPIGRWARSSARWATSRAPRRSSRRRCGSTRATQHSGELLGLGRHIRPAGTRGGSRRSSLRLNPSYSRRDGKPVPQRLFRGGAIRGRAAGGGAAASSEPLDGRLGAAGRELRGTGADRGGTGGGCGSLARHPGLSIQGLLSRPDFSAAERKQTEELMRKAGFPPCAKPEELAKLEKPLPIPECPLREVAN